MQTLSSKEIKRIQEGLPPWESLSFACGGWLQFYLFGVGKALMTLGSNKGVRYYGCSAGGLAAAGMAFEGEFDDAIQFCKDYCVPRAYSDLTGLFQLSDYVSKCLELTILPKFTNLPPGKLNIAVTKLPFFTNQRVSSFANKEELTRTLLSSAAAFPFAPLVKMNGSWYIDGGLSDFQPILDEETITVSPFYFDCCDIKPSRYVPLWWAFMPPQSTATIDWLYQLGYDDCINYLLQRGIPIDEKKVMKIRGRKHKHNKKLIEHPYNVKRTVSMHRFLGYNLGQLTGYYISFAMDLILLLLVIFIWKPLALVLIYAELLIRIILLSIFSLLHTLGEELYPPRLIHSFVMKPYYAIMSKFMGSAVFVQGMNSYHLFQEQEQRARKKLVYDLYECFTCLWSLSLFLRFLSGPPSATELRKHKRLAKFSVAYRVLQHII